MRMAIKKFINYLKVQIKSKGDLEKLVLKKMTQILNKLVFMKA